MNSLAVFLYSCELVHFLQRNSSHNFVSFVAKFKSNVDNDDIMDYVKEGFMTCFAGFMVMWTTVYSARFF